jgi:hypothetical protein
MRKAVQAQWRLANANCPLPGMFSYSDRPFAKESPRLSPFLCKYWDSCFLGAAPHCKVDPPPARCRLPNNKYALSERVTVVPKVQWHCR